MWSRSFPRNDQKSVPGACEAVPSRCFPRSRRFKAAGEAACRISARPGSSAPQSPVRCAVLCARHEVSGGAGASRDASYDRLCSRYFWLDWRERAARFAQTGAVIARFSCPPLCCLPRHVHAASDLARSFPARALLRFCRLRHRALHNVPDIIGMGDGAAGFILKHRSLVLWPGYIPV